MYRDGWILFLAYIAPYVGFRVCCGKAHVDRIDRLFGLACTVNLIFFATMVLSDQMLRKVLNVNLFPPDLVLDLLVLLILHLAAIVGMRYWYRSEQLDLLDRHLPIAFILNASCYLAMRLTVVSMWLDVEPF